MAQDSSLLRYSSSYFSNMIVIDDGHMIQSSIIWNRRTSLMMVNSRLHSYVKASFLDIYWTFLYGTCGVTCASDSRGNRTGITSLLSVRSGQIPVSVRPLWKLMICRLVCSITCKTLDASQPDFWTINITIHGFHERTNVSIDLSVFVVIVDAFNTEKFKEVM